jgi:DNA adenine methylase
MTAVAKQQSRNKATKHNPLVQPFLKWAGGKRQLLSQIRAHLPSQYKAYFEPFIGGGAVLFDLQPKAAYINDANAELINLYNVIKESPSELTLATKKHKNTEDYFYNLRALDREEEFATLTPIERAARIIFLNKTCYNGLFRVNSNGQFNVPYGNYPNPLIVDEIIINAVSNYLNGASVTITNTDFASAVEAASKGDFVYFDPPYDPISDTSSFTGYHLDSFGKAEQKRLKETCDALTARGCKVMLSNSCTDFIKQLYSDISKYRIIEVTANRNINSVGAGRGKISELLIVNYENK